MDNSLLVNQLLENRDAILGFILALTRDYDSAEEIFQEVAKVILAEAKNGASVARFMPWAREIARRRVGEFYRVRARQTAVERSSPSMEDVVGQAFDENEKVLDATHLRFKALLECRASLYELAHGDRRVIGDDGQQNNVDDGDQNDKDDGDRGN